MQPTPSALPPGSHLTTPTPRCRQLHRLTSPRPIWTFPALLPLMIVGLGACVHGHSEPPLTQTLARYQTALQANDHAGAYAMLSPEQQAAIPSTRFADQWNASGPERNSQLAQLKTSLSTGLLTAPPQPALRSVRVSIRNASSPPVELAMSASAGGRWQVARPSLATPDIQTPVAALRGLVQALERLSFASVLRLFSAQARQTLEQELRERLERMRAALQKLEAAQDAPSLVGSAQDAHQPAASITVEVLGNRARIQYDPRFFVEFVREADGWRVRDLN